MTTAMATAMTMTTAGVFLDGRGAPTPPAGGPRRASVLVVDDARVDQRWAGSIIERQTGMRPVYARNGVEALGAVAREAPAAVLTDLRMPEMDGLAFVEAMRARFPLIPVVLMTAHGSEEIALQALQRGAASYVPKRRLAEDLKKTLEQVLTAGRASVRRHRILDSETASESIFLLENDADLIPDLLARLHETSARFGLFDENAAMRVDLALHETLTNGMYHGNLELSSDLRQDGESHFHGLAARRRAEPPYAERRLHVRARFTHAEAVYLVRDEGPGFDPTTLPDPFDPANLERVGGRGLLLIRTFMDGVAFNAIGNEITLRKRRTPRPVGA